jgi:hypothetical protein
MSAQERSDLAPVDVGKVADLHPANPARGRRAALPGFPYQKTARCPSANIFPLI